MAYYKPRRRWGRVVLVVILWLLATLAVAAYFFFRNTEDTRTKQASQVVIDPRAAQNKLNREAEDKRVVDNDKRRADANALMVAVKSYLNQNNGQFPTSFASGKLVGGNTPIALPLTYYKTLTIVSGKQAPSEGDVLKLVVKANCANALSATVDTTTGPLVFVIQFGLQSTDGTFDPQCQET